MELAGFTTMGLGSEGMGPTAAALAQDTPVSCLPPSQLLPQLPHPLHPPTQRPPGMPPPQARKPVWLVDLPRYISLNASFSNAPQPPTTGPLHTPLPLPGDPQPLGLVTSSPNQGADPRSVFSLF